MARKKIIRPQKEELVDGREFTIHGGYYRRCSGVTTLLEYTLPNADRKPGESDNSWLDRVVMAESLESYKKFSNKRKTLRQIKIDTEEMIGQKLYDPIVYGGCELIKIHYTDEKPDVFHWV